MTRYIFLIYGDESRYANATPEDWQQMMDAHNAWAHSVVEGGCTIVGGDALQPTATATSIRHSAAGDTVTTDGPFAETKEALGGFYLIEAPDLDVALKFAATLPGEGVEVRPIAPTD
jgi:hypothetical protein